MISTVDRVQYFIGWLEKETDFGQWSPEVKTEVHKKLLACMTAFDLKKPEGTPAIQNVKCPLCEGEMVSRKGQYGTFWGCKKFPNCRGTRDSMGRSKEERENERKKENGDIMGSPSERQTENDHFRFRRNS